ncbi:asparagine synthetase A [Vibrio ostreicida]|uniref:Asparagine synthetase A n=1 Tax=Vibrio ostreicida TaxID=526588 RepID=A0ABT8BUM1_9VIBR|nr:asparagine synthetase A [Vibrio ostreicida]MDN3610404.1 asparagine synthetase A [Vibrio ostreicida]NPD07586.1 asparaginase [Vibrio ostreicida]
MLVRNRQPEDNNQPPQTWKCPQTHYLEAFDQRWYKQLLEIQSELNFLTHDFYRQQNMTSVMLPITTGSISSPMGLGSDSLPVEVEIAGQPTYLADSMQFMLEYALRYCPNGVFYMMPSFRGEDADKRHLCQFYHSEAEICGSLADVMGLVNAYLHYLVQHISPMIKKFGQENGFDTSHLDHFIALSKNIPTIRFSDAIRELGYDDEYVEKHEAGFYLLTNAGERQLIQMFKGPVWVTHMPALSVPFYQADDVDDEYSLSADLLMGIGETVGCGQRHDAVEDVQNAMARREVVAQDYEWYLEMRKVKPLQTSGFGMGVERFILWLLNHNDIRDCQLVPRFNQVNFLP